MFSLQHFVISVVLLTKIVFLHGIGSSTSIPTAVVVISDTIVENNKNLPHIFEKIQAFLEGAGAVALMQFKTVIAANETDTVDKVCSLLATGVFVLVDISTPRLAPLFKSACQAFGIAYIAMVDTCYFNYPLQRANTDTIIEPPAAQMLLVVADIVLKENLNNVAIVYDETFDIQNTPRRVLTNVPAQHIYIKISSNLTEATIRVNTIMKISIKTIFIIADKANAWYFLKLLLEKKVVNFDPHIFIVTKDSTFNCNSCPEDSRLLLVTAETRSGQSSRFIDFMRGSLLLADFESKKIKVDEALAFDVSRLIISAVRNLTIAKGNVQNIANLDCNNVSTLNITSVDQSLELTRALSQVHENCVFGTLSWTSKDSIIRYSMTLLINELTFVNDTKKSEVLVAKWSQNSQINMIKPPLIKLDIRKKYRVVAVAEIPPFVYTNVLGNGTTTYSGYCIDLLDEIAKQRSFDYTIYHTDDVGTMDEQGQWSGAIAELIEGRADIAIGPISVMAERENVIDFTVPYYDLVGLTILMKKPSSNYSLVKFLSVLDEEVWGCIIAAFFLFSILITVFDKLSPFSYQNRRAQWKETGPEPKVFTFKEGIWFCMMSLTPQGGGETPKALSGRLIAATWWLFGFIIIATYTANLAAFLTVSRLETPIESLDDLSKQFKVKYGPTNGSTAMLYFKRMAEIEHRFYEIWKNMSLNDNLAAVDRAKLAVWDYPVSDKYTKLWETMSKIPFPDNKTAAVKKVLEEDFAYISDASSNKYETLINCDLMVVGDEFSRKPYALAVQEGSTLRSELSTSILTLINNRTLEVLKNKWWKMYEKDCPKLDDESDGISIRNIGGVFLVIVIGSGLSLITLAFECYWYRYRPERRRKALASASSRTQLTTSMASSDERVNRDKNMEPKTAHSRQTSHTGLGPGYPPSEFEMDENNVTGYTNIGFEQTERF